MSKTRNVNLPQHEYDQGHYGELPLEALPSSTELSGSTFLWDGSAWYFGQVSLDGSESPIIFTDTPFPDQARMASGVNFLYGPDSDNAESYLYLTQDFLELAAGTGYPYFQLDNIKHILGGGNGVAIPVRASDPTGGNSEDGQLYYNNATHKFRGYISGSWYNIPQGDSASINFVLDGGGSQITTGIKGDVVVDFACRVQSVTMLADQTGSIVVDIWKDTYANFPPTDADSITASATPTISSANKSQDTTLTGWNRNISAGDILRFNVDSVTTIQRLTIALSVERVP